MSFQNPGRLFQFLYIPLIFANIVSNPSFYFISDSHPIPLVIDEGSTHSNPALCWYAPVLSKDGILFCLCPTRIKLSACYKSLFQCLFHPSFLPSSSLCLIIIFSFEVISLFVLHIPMLILSVLPWYCKSGLNICGVCEHGSDCSLLVMKAQGRKDIQRNYQKQSAICKTIWGLVLFL